MTATLDGPVVLVDRPPVDDQPSGDLNRIREDCRRRALRQHRAQQRRRLVVPPSEDLGHRLLDALRPPEPGRSDGTGPDEEPA